MKSEVVWESSVLANVSLWKGQCVERERDLSPFDVAFRQRFSWVSTYTENKCIL